MRRSLFAVLLLCAAPAIAESPADALKYPVAPVFDAAAVDAKTDPCSDFFRHACGAWMDANPIPPDQASWWRSSRTDERTRAILATLLEEAARDKTPRTENRRKIGDFYASCLDEDAIDAKGLKPLAPAFADIAALRDKGGLAALTARLNKIGVWPLFAFGSTPDFEDASMVVADADQGGFSLPDRDYYLTDEFKSERADYLAHLNRMFVLLGDDPRTAAAEAAATLRVETALAEASMSRVARRVPENVHKKMTVEAFAALTPSFDWPAYLRTVGAPSFKILDATDPGFFSGLERSLNSFSVEEWKSYLRWAVVINQVSALPRPLQAENFDFFLRRLDGQAVMKPRWKRCVASVDSNLGEALGQAYVEREFPPESKKRVLAMVLRLEARMAEMIKAVDWMSAPTKERALKKLASVHNKIGYPDSWRDYSALRIERGDALGNLQRASAFEFQRQLAKIGKPLDRAEWGITAPTDNAYYDPQMNDIVFPAGGLTPPMFDSNADDASNYGAIGAIIGHELTHGFDDEGRHYDADGNLRDWWSADDSKAFELKAAGLVEQYSRFVAVKDSSDSAKDIHVDGKLTLGENVADNGGTRLAYASLPSAPDAATARRFFLANAQYWCQNMTEAQSKQYATADPHSPGRHRVNGVAANMPEFRAAFQCKEGAPMAPVKINRVW